MHLHALVRFLERTTRRRRELVCGRVAQGSYLLQLVHEPTAAAAQGYTLQITGHGVCVRARDAAGAFYGLDTLRQLMASAAHPDVLPRCDIFDFPDYPHRGFMLDISRCKVPTMSSLYRLIDTLAALRYNQLQLYTEHTFRFSAHRRVWQGSSPLNAAQLLRLDAYCRERFIELVPNFNSFGHFERWLRHPSYARRAECPDGFTDPKGRHWPYGRTLYPSRENVDFLDTLYAELLPNFSSPLFHAGCDETVELGMGKSAAQCARKGKTHVYTSFVRALHARIRSHNRRMLLWADMLLKEPGYIDRVPAQAILCEWGYEHDHPFDRHCSLLSRAGRNFYVCPGTSSWTAIAGRTANATANIGRACAAGLQHGAQGMLLTDWGDEGHHQYRPISYPGLTYAAGCAWYLDGNRDTAKLSHAIDGRIYGTTAPQLGHFLMEVGELYTSLRPCIENATHFHHFVFLPLDRLRGYVTGITDRDIRDTYARFTALRTRLARIHAHTDEAQRSCMQLRTTMALLAYGFEKARICKNASSVPSRLYRMRDELCDAHRRTWLLRNRPGGLAESLSRLHRSL
jgi:hypothetical protein